MTQSERPDGPAPTQSRQALLTVRALRKYFSVHGGILHTVQAQVKAVDGVSFDVQRGEILGIVGESGCGKSTLARLIQHLIAPDAGEIRFAGQPTLSTSAAAFKAFCRQVQMVFQDPYSSLNPRMNIEDAVAFNVRVHGDSRTTHAPKHGKRSTKSDSVRSNLAAAIRMSSAVDSASV